MTFPHVNATDEGICVTSWCTSQASWSVCNWDFEVPIVCQMSSTPVEASYLETSLETSMETPLGSMMSAQAFSSQLAPGA